MLPNGLELSCPAEAGRVPQILAHPSGPGAPPYGPARRVSFSELLGGALLILDIAGDCWPRAFTCLIFAGPLLTVERSP